MTGKLILPTMLIACLMGTASSIATSSIATAAVIPADPTADLSGDWSGDWTAKKTFFSEIDKTIQVTNRKIGPRIKADRYFRLMARINVWALYCDPGNKIGYSTRASVLQRSCTKLERLAERVFGGEVPAYNRFERYRNEESLRFIRSDRQEVCYGSYPAFMNFTDMKSSGIEAYVSREPFGSI